MAVVRTGTELTVVADCYDRGFHLSAFCGRVTQAVITERLPLVVRRCETDYDLSFYGILQAALVGTWVVQTTAEYPSPDAVAIDVGRAILVGSGNAPAAIGIASIGSVSTGTTTPGQAGGGFLDGISTAITNLVSGLSTLSAALPWVILIILGLALYLIYALATSPEGRKAALKFV